MKTSGYVHPRLVARSVLILLLLAPASFAQFGVICSLGPMGFGGYNPMLDQPASGHALTIGKRVATVLCGGVCRVDLVRNVSAGNALTLVDMQGKAKIAYAPQFMQQLEGTLGESAVFGVMAHEVGHVIDARAPVVPLWFDNSWSRELRADSWAGCALAKAHLARNAMTAALQAIAAYPSPSHPAWNLRVPALDAGYLGCGGTGQLPQQGSDW
jgi:hypothetical protein